MYLDTFLNQEDEHDIRIDYEANIWFEINFLAAILLIFINDLFND